jgi:hypothetical protein
MCRPPILVTVHESANRKYIGMSGLNKIQLWEDAGVSRSESTIYAAHIRAAAASQEKRERRLAAALDASME